MRRKMRENTNEGTHDARKLHHHFNDEIKVPTRNQCHRSPVHGVEIFYGHIIRWFREHSCVDLFNQAEISNLFRLVVRPTESFS